MTNSVRIFRNAGSRMESQIKEYFEVGVGEVKAIGYDQRVPETVIVEFKDGKKVFSGFPFELSIANEEEEADDGK